MHELIFLLLVVAALGAIALYWMRANQRERLLHVQLKSLGAEQQSTVGLESIPWKALAAIEMQVATGAVLLSLVVAYLFQLPVWFLILQLGVTCPLAWFLVRRYRRNKIRAAFSDRFPEAVDSFMRAVQTGVPVETVLASLGDIYTGELGARFRLLVQQLEIGISFRDALRNFSAELDLADVDFFCAVLALNRETGSPLTPMLQSLSTMLRDRRAVDRKLQALTAETRGAARVLCALPFFIMGLQIFLNPDQMRMLIDDPTGRIVLGYCVSSMIIGFIIIRRMSRLTEE